MIFNLKKRELRIELKEREIQKEKAKFHRTADKNIKKLEEVNKKLGNGITIKILQATGGHHG